MAASLLVKNSSWLLTLPVWVSVCLVVDIVDILVRVSANEGTSKSRLLLSAFPDEALFSEAF